MFGFLKRKKVDPANLELARIIQHPRRSDWQATKFRYYMSGEIAYVCTEIGGVPGFFAASEENRRKVIDYLTHPIHRSIV